MTVGRGETFIYFYTCANQSSSHVVTKGKHDNLFRRRCNCNFENQCKLVKNLVRFMLCNACARAARRVSHSVEFSEFSTIVKISLFNIGIAKCYHSLK